MLQGKEGPEPENTLPPANHVNTRPQALLTPAGGNPSLIPGDVYSAILRERIAEDKLMAKEAGGQEAAKSPAPIYKAGIKPPNEAAKGNQVTQPPKPDKPAYPYFDQFPDGYLY